MRAPPFLVLLSPPKNAEANKQLTKQEIAQGAIRERIGISMCNQMVTSEIRK